MPANPALADRVVLLVSANQARVAAAMAALRTRGYLRIFRAANLAEAAAAFQLLGPDAIVVDETPYGSLIPALADRLGRYRPRPDPVPEIHRDWVWFDLVEPAGGTARQSLYRIPSPFAVIAALTPGVILEFQPVLETLRMVAIGAPAVQSCVTLVRSHAPRLVLVEPIPELKILAAMLRRVTNYQPDTSLVVPSTMRRMRQYVRPSDASNQRDHDPEPVPLIAGGVALAAGAMAAIPEDPPGLDLRGRPRPPAD